MDNTIVQIGTYSLPFPVVLASVLAILFSFFGRPDGTSQLADRVKNGIAILCGVGFGVVIMFRDATPDDFIVPYVSGWILYEFVEGAAAVGLYKPVRSGGE